MNLPQSLSLSGLLKKLAPAGDGKADATPRLTIHLSTRVMVMLGIVLVLVVAWAFFMGVMVGKGQNPQTGVEQLTGLNLGQSGEPAATAPVAVADLGSAAAENRPESPLTEAAPEAAKADYPFGRPQGENLKAWGMEPAHAPVQGGAADTAQGASQPASQATASPSQPSAQPAAQTRPAVQPAAPRFDFVYQTAAFKAEADATKLRTRLEERGIRGRIQKSGKVFLVLAQLRGTDQDADRLVQDLQDMRLGKPIRLSKTPVAQAKAVAKPAKDKIVPKPAQAPATKAAPKVVPKPVAKTLAKPAPKPASGRIGGTAKPANKR